MTVLAAKGVDAEGLQQDDEFCAAVLETLRSPVG
jgi:hypothetical protein